MDPIEFLNSDIVDLPKTRDDHLVAFVDRMLDNYSTQIQRVANRSILARVITFRRLFFAERENAGRFAGILRFEGGD